jgi:hypothetical protein
MSHVPAQLVSQLEHFQRLNRELQSENQRISLLLDTQRQLTDKVQAELLPTRRALAASKTENERLAKELAMAKQLKTEAEEKRAETDEALRRIEGKLVRGKEGTFLLEQNAKLRQAMAVLKSEFESKRELSERQASDLDKAGREIEVLATALELRADELQLGGDLRSGLLYEVAHRREEVRHLRDETVSLQQKLASSDASREEASRQASSALSDLSIASERASRLSSELAEERAARESLTRQVRALEHERDVSLDFVGQQSGDIAAAQMQTQQMAARVEQLLRSNQDLQQAVNAADARTNQIKGVQDITTATLAKERDAARESLKRAVDAETSLSSTREELLTLRAQAAASSHIQQEMQINLSARTQEVIALQSQVRQLAAEHSECAQKLREVIRSNESTAAKREEEKSKLRSELDAALSSVNEHIAISKEASSRAAVLSVEAGKSAKLLMAAQAEIASIRQAKASQQQAMLRDINTLREHLASEQAARHAARVSQAQAEEELQRELRERAKHQRSLTADLAIPKSSSPQSPQKPSLSSPEKKQTLRLESSSTAGMTSSSSAAQLHATSLVREALQAAGLDGSLADEYVAAASASAPRNTTIKSPSTDRPQARNFVPLPSGPADWSSSLRSDSSLLPLSPGAAALREATQRVRAKRQQPSELSGRFTKPLRILSSTPSPHYLTQQNTTSLTQVATLPNGEKANEKSLMRRVSFADAPAPAPIESPATLVTSNKSDENAEVEPVVKKKDPTPLMSTEDLLSAYEDVYSFPDAAEEKGMSSPMKNAAESGHVDGAPPTIQRLTRAAERLLPESPHISLQKGDLSPQQYREF